MDNERAETKRNATQDSIDALTEIVAVEGLPGAIALLAQYIEVEVEMSDSVGPWSREMTDISVALETLAKRARRATGLLSAKEG